jgi:hypothetical protein
MNRKKKQMSVDEIVNDVLNNINDETKDVLANAEPSIFGDYASQFHFGLGTQIRNKYNLWEYGNADDISAMVINKLVKRLKDEKNT